MLEKAQSWFQHFRQNALQMQEEFCKSGKDQTEDVVELGGGSMSFSAFLTFSGLEKFSLMSTYYFDNQNSRTTAGITKH